jgi:chitosanase
MTSLQKKAAQAIVKIFETGKPLGDYGCVTVLKGDTGHLTYGCSQTTLGSGNLALLLHAYCNAGGLLSGTLAPYLSAFDRRDVKLDTNEKVKGLLRQAGDDPVMRKTQDDFFDRIYWEPAVRSASVAGVKLPLSLAVVYDSKIHGSFDLIRNKTIQQHGEAGAIGETAWISAFVSTRRKWLGTNSNSLLHKTVYRMDAFTRLIGDDKWNLPLPLAVRNVVISEDLFRKSYEPVIVVDAAGASERVLFLSKPQMRGDDVKRLQKALGFPEKDVDGVFGNNTDEAVRKFQKGHGLKDDGKVGPATRAALGL